jgi:hypothetical protein
MGDVCMLNYQPVVFACAHQLPGGELHVLLWGGSNCRDADPESTSFNIHNRASADGTMKNFKGAVKNWFNFKAPLDAAAAAEAKAVAAATATATATATAATADAADAADAAAGAGAAGRPPLGLRLMTCFW